MARRNIDLKWAQTIDGQLCDDSGTSQWITSSGELDYTHYIRSKYDAVLVGASTFLIDQAQLTVRRLKSFTGQQPVRIILDPRDRIASALETEGVDRLVSQLLTRGDRPTLIIGGTGQGTHFGFDSKVHYLHYKIDLSLSNERIRQQLESAPEQGEGLVGRPLTSVLVEGGPTLLTVLAEQQAFDRIYVSVAPKITGGQRFRISPKRNLVNSIHLDLVDVSIRSNDVVFEYRPQAAIEAQSYREALQ